LLPKPFLLCSLLSLLNSFYSRNLNHHIVNAMQDVLVYNFFTDSPLGAKWRVVYNYLKDAPAHSSIAFSATACPLFDPTKHHLLCSELKHLYVVLTRARQRLWIFDESPELRCPMLDFW
jgi:hypothetical protein